MATAAVRFVNAVNSGSATQGVILTQTAVRTEILPHSELVALWAHMRNAEMRNRIQSEMNYQLGESREKGWKQPEPYKVDWPKVANFLNDLYERVGIGRPVTVEALELDSVTDIASLKRFVRRS